ncbi:MAG TPA: hypothetical protein VFJ43_09075, partial [Bacteroidia bacterium]|nr:hypothetical protein [Bacteroidia bacterium]
MAEKTIKYFDTLQIAWRFIYAQRRFLLPKNSNTKSYHKIHAHSKAITVVQLVDLINILLIHAITYAMTIHENRIGSNNCKNSIRKNSRTLSQINPATIVKKYGRTRIEFL